MTNKIKEKIHSLVVKQQKDNPKKQIENIIVFIIILIITIIIVNYILTNDKKTIESNNDEEKVAFDEENLDDFNQNNDDLEKKLENTLNKINGVGKVSVLLTYSESSEIIAMYNENTKNTTSEENDSTGGKRITSSQDKSKEVICTNSNGKDVPVTQKIVKPKIEGAVIIAEGANNATVKNNIVQAVEAATNLATYKIQVFEMKS